MLTSLADLEQGHDNEAEPLLKRSLTIQEIAQGSDHPEVAGALNYLALLYYREGRYNEAEPLYNRALAIREKVLGPDDPDVAAVLQKLALLYRTQGRYDDAEPLYKRVLAINEKALGPDDRDVAGALNNLAALYDYQERYAEAEPLLKRALEIQEKTFGPDHPDVAMLNLALLYKSQGRYAEAELLLKQTLTISEKTFGESHPFVVDALNNLVDLYSKQGRYADALPLVRRAIFNKLATTWAALPVLFGAQGAKLISVDETIDSGLNVVQHAWQTSAGQALNALAVRFAAGNDRLAQLVRKNQNLSGEAMTLEKAMIAAVSFEPAKRDAAAEKRRRDRITAIAKERDDLRSILTREFPDYEALSEPEPLTIKDIQSVLADDEALVVVHLGEKEGYVWVITCTEADWRELRATLGNVAKQVSILRGLLKFDNLRPFDTHTSSDLYREILAPVENTLHSKPRLSFVLDGALTSLPPQVLVTHDPAGKELKDVDWLIRTHAVTVLPSVASLKVLRGKSVIAEATKPMIGFANPIFDQSSGQMAENTRVIADITAMRAWHSRYNSRRRGTKDGAAIAARDCHRIEGGCRQRARRFGRFVSRRRRHRDSCQTRKAQPISHPLFCHSRTPRRGRVRLRQAQR